MVTNVSETLPSFIVDHGPRYSRVRLYFATARERYAVYLRRSQGQRPPWTKDPILINYRFCNVYRELDKVTRWLHDNWREPYRDHPNLVFSMALARLINWPPTLEAIGFPKRWSPGHAVRVINKRQEAGVKAYTGAYLLGAIPKGANKAEYLVNSVLTPLYKALRTAELPSRLETAWYYFKSFQGIGDFLAYEIVSDLRHTHYLRDAPDILTWANAGPGALRGLTRLWGFQPKTQRLIGYNFPKERANEAMQMLLTESRKQLPDMPLWEMREVEHHLCEFDKYLRIKEGQGTLERFRPKAADQW